MLPIGSRIGDWLNQSTQSRLANVRKSGLDSPDSVEHARYSLTMGKQLWRQWHQCQAGGAWARSSPAAAERGVEDAGLEAGHAAPDHHDRRLPLIASDTVRQFECRFVQMNIQHLSTAALRKRRRNLVR